MQKDIVLLTIDCWRYDAIARMNNLLSLTADYEKTEAICQSSTTPGVFSTVLSSMYYPHAYESGKINSLSAFDRVKSNVIPLPKILSDSLGYSTGAFIGSNPFLSRWWRYFDYFWNDGLSASPADETFANSKYYRRIRSLYHYLSLREYVSIRKIAKIARKWYLNQSKPRFLFIHIMEPHDPLYPGLNIGLRENLFSTYRTIYHYNKYSQDPLDYSLKEEFIKKRIDIYWRVIKKLDDDIEEILDFIDDDATIFILGDHGEEFNHGVYKHARLYDECVRVPTLIKWTLAGKLNLPKQAIRQIDIPSIILNGLDLSIPNNWYGIGNDNMDFQPSFMINHAPILNRTYAGLRTNMYKLIHTFDGHTGRILDKELYDLQIDREERVNLKHERKVIIDLEDQLNDFLLWVGGGRNNKFGNIDD